jgi:DNA-binding transcriptional regulator YbjK
VTSRAASRAELIGETAIEVLAAEGARGLTHRAVDRAAGLPPGSTSNHARTREALLACALTRITELEAADAAAVLTAPAAEEQAGGTGRAERTERAGRAPAAPGPAAPAPAAAAAAAAGRAPAAPSPTASVAESLAAPIAAMLHRGLTVGRTRLLARYELALEATRRPALRAVYDEASRPFREPVAGMLAQAGSPAPERHARMLIAWCEGVQFDALAGAGGGVPPGPDELRATLTDLIRGMTAG